MLEPTTVRKGDNMATFEVVVGNIGTVYSGESRREANETFDDYVDLSLNRNLGGATYSGRVLGQSVILLTNGEPTDEHDPHKACREATDETGLCRSCHEA